MSEQLDEERASTFDRDNLNSQVRQQQEYIEQLRAELEETKQAAESNQFSTEWIKDNISKKKIFLDENDIPVIDESVHSETEQIYTRQ